LGIQVVPLTDEIRARLSSEVTTSGSSTLVVTPFRIYDTRSLNGFAASDGDRLVGTLTYAIEGHRCEIVTIDAFVEGLGVGTALVEAIQAFADQQACSRLVLFTTNDNLRAQHFYRRRRFRVRAFYPDGMDAVRKIKPKVPMIGNHGIPLRDVIEFEKDLRSGACHRP
jgi:ribosomal protein S18 acetylase RimI-like enzyme